jgi:hypothetical protein
LACSGIEFYGVAKGGIVSKYRSAVITATGNEIIAISNLNNNILIQSNCPQNHGLKAFIDLNNRYYCDLCKRTKHTQTFYGCRECDYDVCSACVGRSIVRLRIEDEQQIVNKLKQYAIQSSLLFYIDEQLFTKRCPNGHGLHLSVYTDLIALDKDYYGEGEREREHELKSQSQNLSQSQDESNASAASASASYI